EAHDAVRVQERAVQTADLDPNPLALFPGERFGRPQDAVFVNRFDGDRHDSASGSIERWLTPLYPKDKPKRHRGTENSPAPLTDAEGETVHTPKKASA